MSSQYGNVTLDGNISDWRANQNLDNAFTRVAGYQVFGAYLLNSKTAPFYVFALSAPAAIGADTTIYLNTDDDSATGYQVFGATVGAEYKIVFNSASNPYLYAYNGAAGTWAQVGAKPLTFCFNAARTNVEFALPVSSLANAPKSIALDVVVNGATYVPGDFSLSDVVKAPATIGGVTLNGDLADWPSAPLVQIPANTVAGYAVYGQLASDATRGDAYVIGLIGTAATDPVIDANTILYLNVDRNAATGYSPSWAAANVGAEYAVAFRTDANGYLQPYLYAATSTGLGALLNGGRPLDWAATAARTGFEIAIPRALLTLAGGAAPTAINFDILVNNSAALPGSFATAPQYTIYDPSAVVAVDHAVKKVAIIYSQETADNYGKGAKDANGVPISQAALATAYADLFLSAQHQAEAAGVSYDILTADQLAAMTAAQLGQYSALVIPAMNNVKDAAQAAQITNVLSQLQSQYHVGLIASGDFMTSDANNALLPSPYRAMQTLFGATLSSWGTGTYSVSVDPGATGSAVMSGYAAGALIGGASGQFAGTTAGYYTNAGYVSYAGLPGANAVTLADINLTTAPGAATTSSVAGVIQTANNGAVNTLFATNGLFGDSNLLSHVIENAAYGAGPALTLDATRFKGMVDSRADMDQSQIAADIDPVSGQGIYDLIMPILQQWKRQYDFVGTYYVCVGDGAAGADNAGNALTLTAPYLKQLLQMGNEIGSHSTDHLIAPPSVDANGAPIPTVVVDGDAVSTWSENANSLYTTAPANGSAPNWTYSYEFGQSNALINQALGITVAGAAVPGANDASATALNILSYYPSSGGTTGYVSGGWTGVGSGSPNAFGYIGPSNTGSVYIAPNVTFDFNEIQYQGKTAGQALADWEKLFAQLSANSASPILVWPWHDYGVTDWNTTTDASNAGLYKTAMFTSFIRYAYDAGYEFVTTEDLASRIAAQQRAAIVETNPTANTINVTVTAGQATDDLGTMALNLVNGGTSVIQNAGGWYAYDSDSIFLTRTGVSHVTATLGASQDDVTHIDVLPMRADLQTVAGDGANLTFSMTGDGDVGVHVRTPGANLISVDATAGKAPTAVTLTGNELVLSFDDGPLAISTASAAGVAALHSVAVFDQAGVATGADYVFGLTSSILANLDALNAVSKITLTDGGVPALTLTVATAVKDAAALRRIVSAHTVTVSDAAARIASLTPAQIAQLGTAKVAKIIATDAGLTLTAAQAVALEAAGIAVASPAGAMVSDTAANLQTLAAAQISGLPAIGVSELYANDANVSYSATQTAAILAANLKVAATGSATVTETFANGDNKVYRNGALISQKTVNPDNSFVIVDFAVTGQPYASDETIYDASGVKVAFAAENRDGTGALTLYRDGVTVAAGSTALSVKVGADVFALPAHASETINAAGTSGDAFVFTPSAAGQEPWHEVINGFVATGRGHDTLNLRASAFGSLPLPLIDFLAVMAHTTNNASGSAVITDLRGDSITLNGVSKATLLLASGDFKFS